MNAEREAPPTILPPTVEGLLRRAGAQAGELKQQRAAIGRTSGVRAILPLKALEAELARTWTAIRSIRAPVGDERADVRRSTKRR
jgi:hypothetical protein